MAATGNPTKNGNRKEKQKMHRRDAETQSVNEITERIIDAAIEVHRVLGPGLLESAYEECLCHELMRHELSFVRQVPLPVVYKEIQLDCGYRIDVAVEDLVILEFKAVERILPIHEAQMLTYLKLYRCPVGLLINFNVPVIKHGIKRIVFNLPEASTTRYLRGE